MTTIEWTRGDDGAEGKTWNPIRGCARVSPGCESCYAERQAHRFSGKGQPYEGLTVLGKHGPRWTGETRFVPETLSAPLTWRKPRRIFVNSMSDLFHGGVGDEQIAAVFGVMAACPQHTFQILTKRPERMRAWFGDEPTHMALAGAADEAISSVQGMTTAIAGRLYGHFDEEMGETDLPWPLPNVHLGVSCEDQQRADERIPHLLACPAAVRFLSVEPMLGPVDLSAFLRCEVCGYTRADASLHLDHHLCEVGRKRERIGVDWVIVGGESGPEARPMHVEWARSIVAQCKSASVPVFVKQLGAKPHHLVRDYTYCAEEREDLEPLRLLDRKGGDPSEWPEDLRVRQFPDPRKAAGLPEVE